MECRVYQVGGVERLIPEHAVDREILFRFEDGRLRELVQHLRGENERGRERERERERRREREGERERGRKRERERGR